MTISIDQLLLLIKENRGVEKALQKIDVEDIEDHDAKVISRTIKYSCEMLESVLVDRIQERDSETPDIMG